MIWVSRGDKSPSVDVTNFFAPKGGMFTFLMNILKVNTTEHELWYAKDLVTVNSGKAFNLKARALL